MAIALSWSWALSATLFQSDVVIGTVAKNLVAAG